MSATQTLNFANRYVRQSDIVPDDKLQLLTITVIGVGAIGRQVASQLAAMGARKLILIDHDYVAPENLATQGYFESELGLQKVTATANLCRNQNSEIEITEIPQRFDKDVEHSDVIFCCVDSIDARRIIWHTIKRTKRLWIDGRMLGEIMRVLMTDGKYDQEYTRTLFPNIEAERGRCTARATIYTSNIIAGLMLAQFNRWLNEEFFKPDIMLCLPSLDLFEDVEIITKWVED